MQKQEHKEWRDHSYALNRGACLRKWNPCLSCNKNISRHKGVYIALHRRQTSRLLWQPHLYYLVNIPKRVSQALLAKREIIS